MILETERLHLRPVVETDVPNIQKYFAHWEIIQHMGNIVPWPYPDDGAQTFYDNVISKRNKVSDQWSWAITEKNHVGQLIGMIDLGRARSHNNSNIGFWIASHHHGKGYMTEALKRVVSFAFNKQAFEEIVISNACSNPASRRVQEKAGLIHSHVDENYNPPSVAGEKRFDIQKITRDEWLKLQRS